MTLQPAASEPHKRGIITDLQWSTLYSFLPPRVRRWVYFSQISSWLGQEEDVVDDIVHEAIARTASYAQRVERGEVPVIGSLEGLSLVIARHYFEDLRRRDWRFTRMLTDDCSSGIPVFLFSRSDLLLEAVPEHVFLESIIVKLPSEIVKFPDKQRTALLIDLANRMDFGGPPTILQLAFLNVGIQMQDYQIPLPVDPTLLSRHRSLLSLAYRRLKELARVKEYCSAA